MERGKFVAMQKHYTEQMVIYLPAIRHTLNITQKQLAERVGLTRQTIMSFENRQRPLPWNTYLALILYFQQYEISKDFIEKLNLFDSGLLTENFQSKR